MPHSTRTCVMLIVATIIVLTLASPILAGDRLYFFSLQYPKVNWFDWQTGKTGKPVEVPPNPAFIVPGGEPDTLLVMSQGKY